MAFFITKHEIISIAFLTELPEADLKDEIISSSINKYIIPIISISIYQQINANPENFTLLLEEHLKPCTAFYVKYAHINQLIQEGSSYVPPEYQISNINIKDLATEVLSVASQKAVDLIKYMNDNYFPIPIPTNKKLISGFLL